MYTKAIFIGTLILAAYSPVYSAMSKASPHRGAETLPPQIIEAGCATLPTEQNGIPRSCESVPTVITAPDGHVFIKETLKGGKLDGSGAEHHCFADFDNHLEMPPRLDVWEPKTIIVTARAVSLENQKGAQGSVRCKYTINLSMHQTPD